MAQPVKTHLPVRETQEMAVRSLGGEDALKDGMPTHCSILAWIIPWAEKPDGLQSKGSQRVGHNRVTKHWKETQASKHILRRNTHA